MLYKTTEKQKIHLREIALEMNEAGVAHMLISSAMAIALEYEGAYDLMAMWSEADSETEKDEILADLQELIEDKADEADR